MVLIKGQRETENAGANIIVTVLSLEGAWTAAQV